MPKRRPNPVHLGGPLGLAGITLLASAVGLVLVANDGPEDTRQTGAPAPAISAERPPIGAVGVEQVTPAQASGGSSAASKGAEITFIVRLKGRPEIDTICRNYKRDRQTAEAAYAELASQLPALQEFRLVGASYSGEINLAYQLPAGAEASRGRIEEIRNMILAIEGVAYADPDFVAHPGEDTRK